MKARWLIVGVIIIVCASVSITVFSGNGDDEEVSVEEATSLLNQAVALIQERDIDRLSELAGSKGVFRSQWESAGGWQAVPTESPGIVDTYVLPAVHSKWGRMIVGGRVLVVEGIDGLGRPYQTDFFVFRSRDSGLNGLAVTNVVYWSGYGIGQCYEDGLVTTALSPSL